MHIIILVIVIVLTATAAIYFHGRQNAITPARAKCLISSGYTVLDVRTEIEFRNSHHPGAIHFPLGDINNISTSFLSRKNIVVYCNTGNRARMAVDRLKALGFENVYHIGGSYKTIL